MNKAEKKFKEWLDERGVSYWYIDQNRNTKAVRLMHEGLKRPDFVVFLDDVGTLLVDVKGYGLYPKKENQINLNYGDVRKYSNFGVIYKKSVWFAVSHKDWGYKVWLWISVRDVRRLGEAVVRENEDDSFYALPMEAFCTIGVDDRLGKLIGN